MADRGDVRGVLRCLTAAALAIGATLWAVAARAEQPCEAAPVPCVFEALPFELRVVDARTGRPLADVHALAEWPTVGPGGRSGSALMALGAVSRSEGLLTFPGWGPIQGPMTGLEIGSDPVITLFRTGYRALVINNGHLPAAREKERLRRFAQDGWTYALEPFRGTPEQWLQELRRVWLGRAFPGIDERARALRGPYLDRLRRVSAERDKVSPDQQRSGGFFWHVDRTLKSLEKGQ
jgi:hypothetical protein